MKKGPARYKRDETLTEASIFLTDYHLADFITLLHDIKTICRI